MNPGNQHDGGKIPVRAVKTIETFATTDGKKPKGRRMRSCCHSVHGSNEACRGTAVRFTNEGPLIVSTRGPRA